MSSTEEPPDAAKSREFCSEIWSVEVTERPVGGESGQETDERGEDVYCGRLGRCLERDR